MIKVTLKDYFVKQKLFSKRCLNSEKTASFSKELKEERNIERFIPCPLRY